MKKLNLTLSGLLLVAILSLGIGTALAYFTANTSAMGGQKVSLEYHATPEEDISGTTKYIRITADKGSMPIYVRARAYSAYNVDYSNYQGESGWVENSDGWCYYSTPIQNGESTSRLVAAISFPVAENGDSANVIVVYEYTPAQYDEDGNPLTPDFSTASEGGESE